MKLLPFILMLATLTMVGCSSVPQIVQASSTTYTVESAGKKVSVALPKEIQATNLELTVDPSTGALSLKASELVSSSQGVISSSGDAAAKANEKIAEVTGKLIDKLPPIK